MVSEIESIVNFYLRTLMLKFKTCSLVVLLLLAVSGYCFPHTLHLKDGRTIVSDRVWEEDGYFKYTAYGATIGISKERVERVQYSHQQKTQSDYFQFDIWPFGITVNKAISLAEVHDVPFHKYGIISINKTFHRLVRNYSDAIHFYYNTNLLGHFAKVELFFTPASKRLHTVKIQWGGQKTKDTKLATEITSMISEKYGKPKKQGKRLFYKDTKWITEDVNRIEMNVSSTAIYLNYLHTDLRQLDYDESEGLKVQRIQSGSTKDKAKF